MRVNFLLCTLLLTLATSVAWADPITLNFDNLKDSAKVTTQFSGLSFTNASAITSGVTLNELEFPPRSGTNVVFNDGGNMTINFSVPTVSFESYFTYDSRLTITAFDDKGNQIGSLSSLFTNNLLLSGVAGSKPNELLSLSSATGISRIVISSSGSFVLDDLKYNTTVSAAVPEPATLSLLISGGLLLFGRRKKRK